MVTLNLLSGSLNPNQHPVTRPDFILSYEQKDITADIAPYLLSLTYTDYMAGQSDELQLEFEDVDGRWLRTWYPEQGDQLSVSLGDQFTGLINWGSFEIAEIEYQQGNGGSMISLKALATGISKQREKPFCANPKPANPNATPRPTRSKSLPIKAKAKRNSVIAPKLH